MTAHFTEKALHNLRHKTGIVIPVYLPEKIDSVQGISLLRDTVMMFREHVANSRSICLSVDGERCGAEVAQKLADEFALSICVSPENRGKLQAAVHGVQHLLDKTSFDYIALIDQDGDHFANELVNFLRAAEHIALQRHTDKMLFVGRRMSRHRPMGFLRGEIEELADRVLLDALQYRAVIKQRPLPLEYVTCLDEFPDFHSGYKLFSRSTAETVFCSSPQQAGVSDDCYYRHACEAVMVVEAIEHGAYFGEVHRSTFNEQPVSTFGLLNRVQLAADKIIWPCKRLKIPYSFVEQWLSNHLSRLLLSTMSPEGRQESEQIRHIVLTTIGTNSNQPIDQLLEPLFV